tara:strand:+ start:456 stop:764 length:309 start_codon:yes stop_codon:yes gene_type:complete
MSEYVTILDNSRDTQYIGLARPNPEYNLFGLEADYFPNGRPSLAYNSTGLETLDSSYVVGAWNWKPPPPPPAPPTPDHHKTNNTDDQPDDKPDENTKIPEPK